SSISPSGNKAEEKAGKKNLGQSFTTGDLNRTVSDLTSTTQGHKQTGSNRILQEEDRSFNSPKYRKSGTKP
ncbi:MAG: hypothetical protein Q8764_01075, partial [Pigeon pea little leaf phytoplasma]|nr:hypothetical protein [Pigeon pea little leaf phytoplasma]MDV3161472.1 hypothetical protein [Pigeon pea little leaf phytoplasma]MDV3200217.1 hypothetical protein [Pigeon pea little leaf phytoplasma]